jgi:hypothetical protein
MVRIIACWLFLFPLSLFGQKVLIKDLLAKMSCSTVSCLGNFLTIHGFNYMEASQGPFYKTYYYVSDKSGSSSGKGISVEQNLVSFEFSEEKKILMIALKTNDRQFYSEIINGMSH